MKKIIDDFHILYNSNFPMSRWFGIEILKSPLDLWTMQEIIYDIKPEFIIETGTFKSGSALYYCHLMDLIGRGSVITIDIEFRENRPKHPRLHHILGSSTDIDVFAEVTRRCSGNSPIMVILDSDHSKEHVTRELEMYHKLVTSGSYLVVEDTALHGNPIHPESTDDPMSALDDFIKVHPEVESDRSREKFLMTWHPKGFLKRL